MEISASQREAYGRDGVIHLPGLLDAGALAEVQAAFDWSEAHATPWAIRQSGEVGSANFQDISNPGAAAAYRPMLEASPIPAVLAQLWDRPEVWFMYEQLFRFEGAKSAPTYWHQDLPYLPVDGSHLAVVWITFDAVGRDESIEFVRGSHLGPMHNGVLMTPDDPYAPFYPEADLPRVPDINANRSGWEIVSWDVAPGDVVIFHPNVLHYGQPPRSQRQRRTLSLRFFGADATYAERPGPTAAPIVEGLHDGLRPGDPFRHPAFPKLA